MMLLIFIQVALVVISISCLIFCTWSCRRKYGYSKIPDEENVSDKLTRDRKFQRLALKEALCQFFLNMSRKYTFVEQLDDIGCRLGRSWFIVKEVKSEKKLLILTKKSSDCFLSLTPSTIQLLRDLFEPLSKHPYIYAINDIDVLAQKPFVFVVEPFNSKGTLKDLIYKRKPREVWVGKYRTQGKALSVVEIKTYGQQILKAMLFLHSKGIPTNGHVHCGNIFVKKGVCRISGYEQAILGFKSRLQPRLSKLLKKNKYAIDTLCFGHLLFEMSYGQELFDAKPGKLHFEYCSRSEEVGEILKFVFGNNDSSYPDLNEILAHRFFQGYTTLDPIDSDSIFFKPQVTRSILKPFKKYFKKMKRKSIKDRSEEGKEAVESPELMKKSHVTYDPEEEKISNPILLKRPVEIVVTSPEHSLSDEASLDLSKAVKYDVSSQELEYDPSMDTESRPSDAMKHDSSGDQRKRSLFGVEALMDSIKQAIQQRHDVLEQSEDEANSRRSSFSSTSSDTHTSPLTSESQNLSTSKNLPDKPSLSKKPFITKSDSLPQQKTLPSHPKTTPSMPKAPPVSSILHRNDGNQGNKSERQNLLKSIIEGRTLRRTVTNDRSAPRV
ncbi:slowpoke-binding protein-like [Xenia sp. Carnegie-2017]|uniref:slowpoke-binding protein-like n=1 Tax=Xenia sp. Carnegie-2017 TaxID=2897299 RepID=UPI001F0468F6|nr:slowpoke-binding protein-like [Xenia sp. Carnegie-2017]